mmetsp:Transcript_4846/g.8489  ORF Transcript_4846/g.8489 Transcript_4846/m.8489 type:complete len:375 (-) Transcript_4846:37-1161(-)
MFAGIYFDSLKDRNESPSKVVQILRACHLEKHLAAERILEVLIDRLLDDEKDPGIALYVGKSQRLQRLLARALVNRNEGRAARKYICRYGLGLEPEFAPHCEEEEGGESLRALALAPAAGPVLTLPLPEERVVVVDGAAALARAWAALAAPGVDRVGLDCEWRPARRRGGGRGPGKVALLQVATRTHAFLFDLMALEPTWHDEEEGEEQQEDGEATVDDLEEEGECKLGSEGLAGAEEDGGSAVGEGYAALLGELFAAPHVTKLGYNFRADLRRLRASFPRRPALWRRVRPLVDLAELHAARYPGARGGLGGLCRAALGGAALDKREQASDWEARPLRPAQRRYAALDAFCLLRVWDAAGGGGAGDGEGGSALL